MPSLDELASRFHDRLKSIKDRTRLEHGEWYPWRSLAAMQMLDQKMGIGVEQLRGMMGGQPVLDIGCGDGDNAFFLESLGAKVDAVDHPLTNYNRMAGVRALKEALGSKAGIHAVDLDARPALPGPDYGMALLLGVLYHLKNPYMVLEGLARNVRWLYMSTRIAGLTPDGTLRFGPYPMAYLVDEGELNGDPTNFWIFSETGLERLARRAGWSVVKRCTLGAPAEEADPVRQDARLYLLLESRGANSGGLTLGGGWHELEYGTSRWTERRFSAGIELALDMAAGTLRFRFQIPEALAARRPVTVVHARVEGTELPAGEFSGSGEREYLAALPGLRSGRVEIEFEVNQAARIGGDERELGVQVYFTGGAPIRVE